MRIKNSIKWTNQKTENGTFERFLARKQGRTQDGLHTGKFFTFSRFFNLTYEDAEVLSVRYNRYEIR